MPAAAVNSPPVPGEGPEEGEIVSEDQLEDISDCSMTFTPNGKSFSRSHHLKALSLSSVTENELDDPPEAMEKRRKRRKSHAQRPKRRKKIRKRAPNSESSDDETSIDERLKLQLKAAVHVEVEEAHRNSLRTRLRAMVKDLEPENEVDFSVEAKQAVTVIDLVEQDTSSVIEVVPTGESDINLSGLEDNIDDSENDSIVENTKINEELDNELMQLRLEALKTAINNKFSKGRKRKKDTNENKENTGNNNSDVSKNVKIPETSPQPSIDSENNTPQSPDEDEDVMRALLLASMSKKIMKSQPETGDRAPSSTQTKQAIIRQNKLFLNKINNFRLNNKVKRVLANTKKVFNVQMPTKVINMPQVKPLIITLDSESDSDWDISSSPEKPIKKLVESKKVESVIEKPSETENQAKEPTETETITKEPIPKKADEEIINSVEKFLKEQRAKVESELSKATSPTISKKTATKPLDLEKSALKYLSESKREEYRKLQNLLKMKMKKPRARRISHKLNNSKNLQITVSQKMEEPQKMEEAQNFTPNTPTSSKQVTKPNGSANLKVMVKNQTPNPTFTSNSNNVISPNTTEKTTKQANKTFHNSAIKAQTSKLTQTEDSNVQLPKEVEEKVHAFKLEELKSFKRDKDRKSGSALMRAKLRELQSNTNGRLQIQDKYKPIRPLVKKMIDLNKQQKQCDQEVERLMHELIKAREKQDVLHRTMSSAIVKLIEEKKKIDVSHTKTKELTLSTTLVTSTPIKSVTGKPLIIPSPFTPSASVIAVESKTHNSHIANTWEQSTVCNKVSDLDDVTLCNKKDSTDELTVVDPNDIDNIIQETAARVAVLEKNESFEENSRLEKVRYVSPLDSARRKSAIGDPFKIICPFEVNGTCKDPDCTYNHFLK